MNALKNTIVTVTLLIVGYGAYKVLKNPPAENLDSEMFSWTEDGEDSAAPKAELPEDSAEVDAATQQRSDLIGRIGAPTGDDSSSVPQDEPSQELLDQNVGGQDLVDDFSNGDADLANEIGDFDSLEDDQPSDNNLEICQAYCSSALGFDAKMTFIVWQIFIGLI